MAGVQVAGYITAGERTKIDISGLPPGAYMVKAGKMAVQKIIKQ